MTIGQVSLTASARSNLLSLQNTAALLSSTQNKLATGKKINTALDGATAYFASQGFLNRANDLSNLKDGLATSLQTVKSAADGITSITNVINQMQGIINSALQSSDATTRSGLSSQYNSLRIQIDYLVDDSKFNGTNLLDATTNLTVYFNESNSTAMTISGVNATSAGLGVAAATNAFVNNGDILAAQSLLQTALATLRTDAAGFGNSTTVVSTRQDFTNNLINTLQTASDNLVLADTNEESANLQALQTRNQLGVISLGISNQAQQAILRLF
ncbi:MAG: flagellin [Alphaproteobacteria bacterium]|nr:flagellin [Alphaproteobacteria bacterium]